MIRVPLALRGVAVVLFAASTVFGQTVEPPAELPVDPSPPGSPDLIRDYSTESRHPLLNWMTEGQLTSFDSLPSQDSARLQPKPQVSQPSTAPATEPSLSCTATEPFDSCPVEIDCPSVPICLPFAYPPQQPPCHGHKCHRRHKHSTCGGSAAGYGNPYLGWPCAMNGYGGGYAPSSPYQGCGCRKCQRKHHQCGSNGPGYAGCGYPYGGYAGGCGSMGCGGFMDGGYGDGCSPFMAPPPPPQCHCRKCQRKHHGGQQGYGYPGYGFQGGGNPYGGGYGGGWGGMGFDGGMDGCCGGGYCSPFVAPPPPPQCHCRKCQRKHHGGQQGYGYQGCGYPGWPAYPVPGASMVDGGYNDCNGYGCGKHHHGLFHHCRACHHKTPPYPYSAYPMMMNSCCMQEEMFCSDCPVVEDCSPPPASSSGTTK